MMNKRRRKIYSMLRIFNYCGEEANVSGDGLEKWEKQLPMPTKRYVKDRRMGGEGMKSCYDTLWTYFKANLAMKFIPLSLPLNYVCVDTFGRARRMLFRVLRVHWHHQNPLFHHLLEWKKWIFFYFSL